MVRVIMLGRQTAPLVDYYRGRGILLELSTDRPEAEVQADLADWLEGRGLRLPPAGGIQTVPGGISANNAAEDQ